MPEPFTIEKLVPLMDEAGVDRAVVVPPSWIGERNDYGLEAARRYPDRFRVMGRFPLNNPAAGQSALQMEGSAGHARNTADLFRCDDKLAERRHGGLVLAGGREERDSVDGACAGAQRAIFADC
jgi:hypothetical protein